ncbi:hypothetical protein [Thermosediminibacter oceani]|uniref:Uncharacterized protein n=1 Tax=Thermosediminibacter oceani (strain ATCC BAA-1034 / DSM 16646 / JW/IW-1228P) TaxID=555079 RepID=D9RZD8_THEOJ|nr:hypothetical protein [Thermosediminibacter oceani]ADL06836.1 hypothetical protein Toce_0039 [Thermosediminibacter oceani DSM 16646]
MLLLGLTVGLGVAIVVLYFFARKYFIGKKGCIKEPPKEKKKPVKPLPAEENPVGVPEPPEGQKPEQSEDQKTEQPEDQKPEQPEGQKPEQAEGQKPEQPESQEPEQPEDKKAEQEQPVEPVPSDKAKDGTDTPEAHPLP